MYGPVPLRPFRLESSVNSKLPTVIYDLTRTLKDVVGVALTSDVVVSKTHPDKEKTSTKTIHESTRVFLREHPRHSFTPWITV